MADTFAAVAEVAGEADESGDDVDVDVDVDDHDDSGDAADSAPLDDAPRSVIELPDAALAAHDAAPVGELLGDAGDAADADDDDNNDDNDDDDDDAHDAAAGAAVLLAESDAAWPVPPSDGVDEAAAAKHRVPPGWASRVTSDAAPLASVAPVLPSQLPPPPAHQARAHDAATAASATSDTEHSETNSVLSRRDSLSSANMGAPLVPVRPIFESEMTPTQFKWSSLAAGKADKAVARSRKLQQTLFERTDGQLRTSFGAVARGQSMAQDALRALRSGAEEMRNAITAITQLPRAMPYFYRARTPSLPESVDPTGLSRGSSV